MIRSPGGAAVHDAAGPVACEITWRHDWASHLFSFRTVRPDGLRFAPGQFVRIGLSGADGTMIWRAYSMVSAPDAAQLEFYSIVVPDGPFTQPLARLAVGDAIHVDPIVYGFLRTDRFTSGRDLWLLATGTGIAPYIAMLDDPAVWTQFEHIVVVHSVRRLPELAYRERFIAWAGRWRAGAARLVYLPTLTKDVSRDVALHDRITHLLDDGRLEEAAGLRLSVDDSRLMICGNPSMIRQVRAMLGVRGMTPVRRETPGQFITENFW